MLLGCYGGAGNKRRGGVGEYIDLNIKLYVNFPSLLGVFVYVYVSDKEGGGGVVVRNVKTMYNPFSGM